MNLEELKKLSILHTIQILDDEEIKEITKEEKIRFLEAALEELTEMEDYPSCQIVKEFISKLKSDESTEL
jgi:protein-arginine kinase activator protein McsA